MVDGQVRTTDVTAPAIIAAMLEIPREQFVPARRRSLAYIDEDIELTLPGDSDARFLMEPSPFAKLVQLADVGSGDFVLDVGCATGYSAAVLSRLASSVIALECDAGLAAAATENLSRLGYDNVVVVEGPLQEGYAPEAPYDVIFVGGAVDQVPAALFDQLPTEGSLAGVLGHEIGHVLARHGNQRMAKQGLFQGLAGAIGVLGGDVNSARMAQMVTAAISMKYGRDQELESDDWGVRLMGQAGYDPRSMITVMEVLKKATGGGGGPLSFVPGRDCWYKSYDMPADLSFRGPLIWGGLPKTSDRASAGSPASRKQRTTPMVAAGASSGPFSTTEQPAARAAESLRAAWLTGTFQVVKAATGPMGSLITRLRTPGTRAGMTRP